MQRFGKYRGYVTDNSDPRKLGRVKARVPEVFGETEITDWAWPVSPAGGYSDTGFFFVPEIGSGVYIEFEAGNVNRPLWTGFWWAEKDGLNEIPTEAKTNYPSVRIIKTRSGQYIMFDDKLNLLKIYHPSGSQKSRFDNGDVTEDIAGNLTVEINTNCNIHAGGNITIDADGFISLNP